jgi:integrase
MNDLIVVPQQTQWHKAQGTRARQRLLPDYETGLQSRAGRILRVVWPGAPARIHQGGDVRLAELRWKPAGWARSRSTCGLRPCARWPWRPPTTGLLAPELASGIARVKGVASEGVRLGNWLTVKQAQALLNTPDASTTKGLRDRAILAVLLGCGLRRLECAALTFAHVQQRDGRWCIVDLAGKHGPVRTIPMPGLG